MSTDYRIQFEKPTTIDELLSSTVLRGVDSKHADKNSMFVSMAMWASSGVWFYFDDNRVIKGFTRYGGNYEVAEQIVNEIEVALGVQVLNEHDDAFLTTYDRFWFMRECLFEFFTEYFEVRKEAQEIHDHCMNARFLLEDGDFQGKWDENQCGSYRSIEDNENYFFELLNPGE